MHIYVYINIYLTQLRRFARCPQGLFHTYQHGDKVMTPRTHMKTHNHCAARTHTTPHDHTHVHIHIHTHTGSERGRERERERERTRVRNTPLPHAHTHSLAYTPTHTNTHKLGTHSHTHTSTHTHKHTGKHSFSVKLFDPHPQSTTITVSTFLFSACGGPENTIRCDAIVRKLD